MKNRGLLQFLAGRFVGLLGDQLLLFAVPLLVYEQTGSVQRSGLIMFIEWVPRILSMPLAGVLSDRTGGRLIYLTSDFARALACFVAYLALRHDSFATFTVLAMLVGFVGFFNAQAFVALESTLPKVVGLDSLPKAQALLQAGDQVSQIAGPALATLLAQWVGKEALVAIVGGAFFISFANLVLLPGITLDRGTRGQRTLRGDLLLGVKTLLRYPALFKVIVLTWFANLILGVTFATSPAIVTGVFGKADRYFGMLTTVTGCFAVAGFVLVPRLLRRFSVAQLGLSAFGVMVTGALVAGGGRRFAIFATGATLLFGSVGVFNVFLRTERARIIPSEHLGKTMGVVVLLNLCALPCSGLLVSAGMADRLGPQGLILAVTLLSLIPAAVLLPQLAKRSVGVAGVVAAKAAIPRT